MRHDSPELPPLLLLLDPLAEPLPPVVLEPLLDPELPETEPLELEPLVWPEQCPDGQCVLPLVPLPVPMPGGGPPPPVPVEQAAKKRATLSQPTRFTVASSGRGCQRQLYAAAAARGKAGQLERRRGNVATVA